MPLVCRSRSDRALPMLPWRRWTRWRGAVAVCGLWLALLIGGARATEPVLLRVEVVDDLETLLRRLEEIHPDPWWHTPRDRIAAERDAILSALPERVPLQAAHTALRRITGLIGDGHVDLGDAPADPAQPDGWPLFGSEMRAGMAAFPLRLDPHAGTPRIGQIDVPGLAVEIGEPVLAINGQDVADLLTQIERLRAGSPALKRVKARVDLPYELWVQGLRPPFTVTLASRVEALAGWTLARLRPQTASEPLRYALTDDRLGILTLDSMPQDGVAFRRRLEAIFEQIASDAPRALVVDLRRNGGGNSGRGEELLDYLTDRPYRSFAEKRWKVSAACQRWHRANGTVPSASIRRYLAAQPGEEIRIANPLRNPRVSRLTFRGPVAVLIGPETFSSGVILANAVGDFGLATLVGRPTAEPATGHGEICETLLPHSGITLTAPSALLVRANGDASDRNPVQPDILVHHGAGAAAEDPDLAAVRAWLGRRRG